MGRTSLCVLIATSIIGACGCARCRPHITAVSLSPMDYGCETGIPFYLPKPLLIIAKNFRSIETSSVGLTDTAPIPNGFDDQSKYADVNARTNFNFDSSNATGGQSLQSSNSDKATSTAEKSAPHVQTSTGAPISPRDVPGDGLTPDTFFTYHIVFVPDMTQKYGLKIRGGPGEIRAAMNLVNGWQFTGLGPYYMKDSSTAQNILSAGIATRLGGQAVSDVVKSVADLAGQLQHAPIPADDARLQSLASSFQQLPTNLAPMTLSGYAEIHVYEAQISPDGQMCWMPLADHVFDREYLGTRTTKAVFAASQGSEIGQTQSGEIPDSGGLPARRSITDQNLARAAVAQVLGIPQDSPALLSVPPRGALQHDEATTTSTAGGVQQVQVDCGKICGESKHEWPKWHDMGIFRRRRGKVQTGTVRLPSSSIPSGTLGLADWGEQPESALRGGGELESGEVFSPRPTPSPIINQSIVNNLPMPSSEAAPKGESADDGAPD